MTLEQFINSLSASDIEAIAFALSVLPSLGLEDNAVQAAVNRQCCVSASSKVTRGDANLSANEFCVLYSAVQAVQIINSGGLSAVSSDIKKQCNRYLFTVNKLSAALSSLT